MVWFCFENHLTDIDTINMELQLADLSQLQKQKEKVSYYTVYKIAIIEIKEWNEFTNQNDS